MKHIRDKKLGDWYAIDSGRQPKGAPQIAGIYLATLCGQVVHRSELTGEVDDQTCPLCAKYASGDPPRCNLCGDVLEPERTLVSDNCGCQ